MIKTCILCGKEFETNYKTKKICDDTHFNVCCVCGTKFEVNSSTYKKQTCSKECMKVLMSQRLLSEEVREKIEATNLERYGAKAPSMNKEVQQKARKTTREKYGVDYAIQRDDVKERRSSNNVEKYGVASPMQLEEVKRRQKSTLFEHYGVENPSQSPEIRSRIEKTNQERYGVSNPMQSEEVQKKAEQTFLSTYGVTSPMKSEEIRRKVAKTNLERYGVDTPFKSMQVQNKSAKTNLEKYGTIYPSQNPDVKAKIRSTVEERYGGFTLQSPILRKKVEETCIDRYGTKHPIQNKKILEKRIQTTQEKYGVNYTSQLPETHKKSSVTRKSCIASNGVCVDSNYELIVYEFCLRNGIPFKYQPKQIEYEVEGTVHKTTIDFEIDGLLFEVKGGHLLHGCFEYAHVPINSKLEAYRKNHVIVITDESGSDVFGKPESQESCGLKYTNVNPYPLIGVDIALFQTDVKFPFRPDRPECFYKVKVNGNKSCYDAFYDENIRWKMIKNRIKYTGGFINNKQVLKALNVTKNYKQPSWFPKSFAKRLISKYCTENIIVDPFAGWGTRCDAAFELHKQYIGVDLNEEAVAWHQEHGRVGIKYGDATTFTYSGKCSVLICPPYTNTSTNTVLEDYGYEKFNSKLKSFSQCDWLRIVMQNIPNASEYVMVCKIVDPGWEEFIVDTKVNKSHFGSNTEYVLCVMN